jgi:CxxC motif-containing protein (DUF1111 family)
MRLFCVCATLVLVLAACGGGGGGGNAQVAPPNPDPDPAPIPISTEHLAGGEATATVVSADAFSSESQNMSDAERIKQFNLGNDFFENPWVSGNASTSSRDGLGGLFNNNACQDCHIRDGRGHAASTENGEDGTDFSSLLLKAIRTDINSSDIATIEQSLLPGVVDSSVGGQIQHEATSNILPEAALRVSYSDESIEFDDGTSVLLRRPVWQIQSLYEDAGYPFDAGTAFSARVAPPMIGMGLLALISEGDILRNEDSLDSDGNGISGSANYVWSIVEQGVRLGRFGWRAGQPSILEQSASAFVNDMGLTSRIQLQENCLPHQAECLAAPNGNGDSVDDYDYEVSDTVLDAVTFYASHLAVPIRRNYQDESVLNGKALFAQAGCTGCHVASYTTGISAEQPELSEQVIFPYTDLLLHDMGKDLADFNLNNEPVTDDVPVEFLARPFEWRTPPLWGIGLAKTVDPQATFLHDGRARTILEAVLWHGGEAAASRDAVLAFDAAQREGLLAFLNDL